MSKVKSFAYYSLFLNVPIRMTIEFCFDLMLRAILTMSEAGEQDDKWSSDGHQIHKVWKMFAFTLSALFMMAVFIAPIIFIAHLCK